jgi:heme-binding protein
MSATRTLAAAVSIAALALVVIQAVPYGRDRSVPPDGQHVSWSSPATQTLVSRACYDCHSNQTRWPWYASIAPLSWRIQSHVQHGREALNFTAFEPAQKEVAEAAREAGETVSKGEMPPFDYLLAHPEARLTADERRTLIGEFDRVFAALPGEGGREGRDARASRDTGSDGDPQGRGRASHEDDSRAGDDD